MAAHGTPVVILVPISAEANKALRLARNRPRLEPASAFPELVILVQKDLPYKNVARIDISLFAGRRTLSFGTSKAADFRLPQVDGAASCHFLLHLDLRTGSLLFTDTSTTGTYLSARTSLLHHTTYRVEQRNVHISLGSSPKIEFAMVLAESMSALVLERTALMKHTSSLIRYKYSQLLAEEAERVLGSEGSRVAKRRRISAGREEDDGDRGSGVCAKKRRSSQMVFCF